MRNVQPLLVSPLTLTLSPQAGRGDVPCLASVAVREGAASPFSPSGRGEGGGSRMRGNLHAGEVCPCP